MASPEFLLRSALRYAEIGWPVLPCAGKKPLTASGFLDASTDPDTITEWWGKNPSANIGVAVPPGMVVVDVDSPEALSRLKAHDRDLPSTTTCRTGRGWHFWYRTDSAELSQTDLEEGVDARVGGKGYVIVPPSLHPDTQRTYEWRVTPLHEAEAPEWITETLSAQGQRLDTEKVLEGVAKGERNRTLFRLASKLRGADVPIVEALELVLKAADRCQPPLAHKEATRITKSVYRRYKAGTETRPAPPVDNHSSNGGTPHQNNGIRFTSAVELADRVPPKVDWIMPGLLARGAITELDGKVKRGKTTYVLDMLSAILDGGRFLGEQTAKKNVVLLTEQPLSSLGAALRRSGLMGREGLRVLLASDVIGVEWHKIAAAAIAECERHDSLVLVVDTLPRFAGLRGDAENNAGDALAAMEPLEVAAKKGLAVLFTRHERKGGGEVGDAGRGSSAFGGVVDILLSLRPRGGNSKSTLRELHSLSRFEETPDHLVVEWTEDGYVSRGDSASVAAEEARKGILRSLPSVEDEALTVKELTEGIEDARPSTVRDTLNELVERGEIRRNGEGKKGSPFRFFIPLPEAAPDSDEVFV